MSSANSTKNPTPGGGQQQHHQQQQSAVFDTANGAPAGSNVGNPKNKGPPHKEALKYHRVKFAFLDSEIGQIIGINGSSIKSISAESKCKLNIYESIRRSRTLSIYGPRENIPLAIRLLAEVILNERVGQNTNNDHLISTTTTTTTTTNTTEENNPTDDSHIVNKPKKNLVSLYQILDKEYVSPLIGRKGATIKNIREESKADILIKNGNEDDPVDEVTLIMRGTPQSLETAVAMCLEVFHRIMLNSISAQNSHKQNGGAEQKDSIEILSQYFKYLKLNRQLSSNKGKKGNLRNNVNNENSDGGGVNKGEKNNLVVIESNQSIVLNSELAGVIIGKKGNTVNKIRSVSGANVIVKSSEEENSGISVVIVSGKPTCVALAFDMIESVLQQHGYPVIAQNFDDKAAGRRKANPGKSPAQPVS